LVTGSLAGCAEKYTRRIRRMMHARELILTAEELKKRLHLEPHPREGGWFVQTWKSEELIAAGSLDDRYPGPRSTGSAIYYLLEPGTFSEMHKLESDEVFHFYLGDPVEMLQLLPDGGARTLMLGRDLNAGMLLQAAVPRGVWQGSRVAAGGNFALLGCTVSPGFEYEDYTTGNRAELTQQYPDAKPLIEALTRE
jgi:predicted cupin superfamily sugar epimerase